jgi:D-beta-D-heptose 7-phosphate kinase/D-beta-D-heptose 1-phosphate adenosyltransferase
MRNLLNKMARRRILVIGDILLDRYLRGDAERLSPEAPVPVMRVTGTTEGAGGAANVALNLRALGLSVELVGVAGQDAEGRTLAALLAAQQIHLDRLLLRRGGTTIVKTRVMCRHQQLCRLDVERDPETYALAPEEWDRLLAPRLAAADAVILSDYGKGVITSELIRWVQAQIPAQTLLALAPKPRPALTFCHVPLVVPNRTEALGLAGLGPAPGFPAAEVTARIFADHAPRMLVVTLGAEGMLVCLEKGTAHRIPTAAREVFDVCGAGDTVLATLTAALAAGAKLEQAATLANLAAGVVVGKLGVATATPGEILAQWRDTRRSSAPAGRGRAGQRP